MAIQTEAPSLVLPAKELAEVTPAQADTMARLEEAGVLPRGFAALERSLDRSPLRHRAAEYVRMSTEHQQYSTANQHDVIVAYAGEHSLEIVRAYSDDGRSGLTLRGRDGLRAMLADVIGGNAEFGTILVYDVSRWGRFQDPDESAYYEFLCRREGVRVEYCAEPFRNDGTATSALIKNIKRMMAGEFSRELGVKVGAGKFRVSRRGLHVGGEAPYGMRRVVVNASGQPRQVLETGEWKASSWDRVILQPGPASEVRVVKWLFKQVAGRGARTAALAAELNRRGVAYKGGRPWNPHTIEYMLSNEKYIGVLVYGKRSERLHTPRVHNPPEDWVRVEGAYRAVVDPILYRKAQGAIRMWPSRLDNDSALVLLRSLLDRRGRLTADVIDAEEDMPGSDFYRDRFGGLPRAYALIGYRPNRDYAWVAGYGVRERLVAGLRERVAEELRARGLSVEPESAVVVRVAGRLRLGVLLAQRKLRKGLPRWLAQTHVAPPPDWLLIARLDVAEPSILDYTLVRGGMQGTWLGARHRDPAYLERRDAEFGPLLDTVVASLDAPLPPPVVRTRRRGK